MRSFRHFLFEGLEPVEHSQLGSNPGGVHHDPDTGKKFYVKFYKDPDQGRSEVLTGQLYRHMGIHTTDSSIQHVGGREAVVSHWNDDLEGFHHGDFHKLGREQHRQIGRIFHGAVLTKNWDVVGTYYDNLMRHKDTGDVHSIDHGGSFRFRARGGPKEYDSEIGEHHSLRHNQDPSGHVFDHVFSKDPDALVAGKHAVAGMDTSHVHDLFKGSGLHDWSQLHDNFNRRRDRLLST